MCNCILTTITYFDVFYECDVTTIVVVVVVIVLVVLGVVSVRYSKTR